ncbi:sugar phosphate isomerase/epimerase family protein [Archaeoglobus sp.]
MNIGINSRALKQFNSDGLISLKTASVDIVELSLAEIDFLEFGDEVVDYALEIKDFFGIEYTVHAPYQDSEVNYLRVDFGKNDPAILEIMSIVFDIAQEIEANTVVVHAGDMHNSKSFKNAVNNIREIAKLAEDYGITIAIENIYTNELGVKRLAELPEEMLKLVEEVAMDNVSINLDVGHANISAMLYNRSIIEWFELLKDFIVHMHVHNNYGLNGIPWDKHLPLDFGVIDYVKLKKYLNTENVVLEIKQGNIRSVVNSLKFLKYAKSILV